MSFLSIIKNIEHTLGSVGQIAAPVVGIFDPPLGSIVQRISDAVVLAEAKVPADNNGTTKSALVVQDFQAGLAIAQEILRSQGKDLQFDQTALQAAIDAQVAAFDAYKKLKDSIKFTDVAVPTATPLPVGIPPLK